MSGSSARVYSTDGLEHPAQDHFAEQYDLNNPDSARTSYQKLLHEHTKQQFELATASSRRRSADSDSRMASLSTESSNGSVSSTSS